MVKLRTEAFPGELAELRAVAAIIKARGCVTCQMRATIAVQIAKRATACAREYPLQHAVLPRPHTTKPTEPNDQE